MARHWAFGLYVRESIANAGMRGSFGIAQLSGKPGEKRKHCKASVKELEARRRRGKVFVFLLVSRECSREKERLTWSSVAPHDGYDVPVIDILLRSCDRP